MAGMLAKRWWTLGALAALSLLLAWLAQRPATPPATQVPAPVPADLVVTAVAVQSDSGTWELLQQQGQWAVVSPAGSHAVDTARVEQLLDILRVPAEARYSLDAVDLQSVGLAPPRARVTINGQLQLALGGNSAIGQSRYLATQRDVLLVSPLLAYYLEQAPDFYYPREAGDD